MTKHLLFIAHAPSVNTRALRDAVAEGVAQTAGVELTVRSPLEAATKDVLRCDGLILLTTENIGYMAGLTKDFFDRCYNDLLDQHSGLSVATLIRAGLDGTATKRALSGIYSGLGWLPVSELMVLHGAWDDDFIVAARETGQAMAEGLDVGIF